jgi:ABC-type sugar transport system permease subunit
MASTSDMLRASRAPASGEDREVRHKQEISREALTWANVRRSWQAYALLLPIFALLIVFVYYPPILGLIRAFYDWRPLKDPVFVGLANFRQYLAFPESGREITNVIRFFYWGLLTGVVAPFIMAELIFSVRSMTSKELYRWMVVIPMLVPATVFTLMWRHIYDPGLGPINSLLDSIGLHALSRNWLGDPATALVSIVFVGFPWVATAATLIYMGGLAQISESVFDACLLDGCVGVRRVLTIDLPLVLGQVRMLTILAGINALTSFNAVLILTNGGPGYSTSVPGLRMYERAFSTSQFGYASAIGLILFVMAMLLTLIVNKTIRPLNEVD